MAAVITMGAKEEVRYDKVALYTTLAKISMQLHLSHLHTCLFYVCIRSCCKCVNV